MSINSEPNPNAQMPAGKVRQDAGVVFADSSPFKEGEIMEFDAFAPGSWSHLLHPRHPEAQSHE
jgi:hypothetical protein